MKKIIERFDRSYIINLRDRTDRKRDVIREFKKVGIDLPHPKIEFYTADRPTERGSFPSLGARGVFTSHREVLHRAIQRDLSNVLVFEDDVSFRDVPNSEIDNIVAALDCQPWDLLYFGYVYPSDEMLSGPLAQSDVLTLGSHFCGINGPFIRHMAQYMDECARRPRHHRLGGPASRDGVFNHLRVLDPTIKVLLAVPNLADQRSSRTDIGPLKIYDRLSWMQPVMYGIRAIKNRMRLLGTSLK